MLNITCFFLQDRHTLDHSAPPIDAEQNWFLAAAEESDGVTVLQFYRDFITCDDDDRSILVSIVLCVY